MRITVADLDAPKHPTTTSSSVPAVDGFEQTAHLLYVPIPAGAPSMWVDNAMKRLPTWTIGSTMTVFSVHPWHRDELDEDVLDDLGERLTHRPLYTLEHDETGALLLRHKRGDTLDEIDVDGLLVQLRSADLLSLLKRPGAYLPKTPNVHYDGPNNHHHGAVLRPGFALQSTRDSDRVAFWTLEAMRGRSVFIVDHWSMRATAHHCASYAQRFYSSVAEGPPAPRINVESIRRYAEDRDQLTERLKAVLPSSSHAEAMAFVSVNSTGALVHDLLIPALEGAQQTAPSALALAECESALASPQRTIDHLAQLDDDFAPQAPDACELCASRNSILLTIEPDTQLMRLSAYTSKQAITIFDAQPSRDTIARYASGRGDAATWDDETDLAGPTLPSGFALHRTHSDERHHAYYVDVDAMMTRRSFQEGLVKAVDKLRPLMPEVIIHPRHGTARRLAQRVAKIADVQNVIAVNDYEINQTSNLTDDDRDLLTNSHRIMIVDDVVITGRRIHGYRQELIKLRRLNGRDVSDDPEWPTSGEAPLPGEAEGLVNMLCGLAGAARARDEKALKGTADFLHHMKPDFTFSPVETVYLPNWEEHQCIWCQELELLRELPEHLQQLPQVQTRIDALRADQLAPESIFFAWPGTAVPALGALDRGKSSWRSSGTAAGRNASADYSQQYMTLNPGSIFGPVQSTDLMVSLAATLQAMRASVDHKGEQRISKLDEHFQPPISKVLDPELYLLGRFYEPVLTAAILRSGQRWDLRPPDGDDELDQALRRIADYLTSGESLLAELIVLAALDRIPRSFLRNREIADPELRAFRDALIGPPQHSAPDPAQPVRSTPTPTGFRWAAAMAKSLLDRLGLSTH